MGIRYLDFRDPGLDSPVASSTCIRLPFPLLRSIVALILDCILSSRATLSPTVFVAWLSEYMKFGDK